jgi:uncharacterized peroxidase-related enzyme
MSRLPIPTREDAPASSQPLLDAVDKQLGTVPNLFRLMSISPAVLQAYLGLGSALGHSLDARTRERIAIAVAQINGCDYCLSAHTYLGLNLAKLDPAEIALNRKGFSSDAKADGALVFAAALTRANGKVNTADLAAVRQAGYTDAQILEIVAIVIQNYFSNFLNHVADTEIDFPVVHSAAEAQPVRGEAGHKPSVFASSRM